MSIIEVSTIVNTNKNIVYNLLRDMHRFPAFMCNIKKLEIIKHDKNRLITSWEVEIDGVNILWKEEDNFNDKEMGLKFKMIEGDYKGYKGQWQLEATPKGTKISIYADFDWGIPVFEKFVRNILERKARKYLKSMLKAIKVKTENKK